MAHPDDETIWCGGLLIMCADVQWLVAALCRAGDADRRPRFLNATQSYGCRGKMADLDDGPGQDPLPQPLVEQTILDLAGQDDFKWLITHSVRGEYTRHRRHEEAALAVMNLWLRNKLRARRLWMFAYEDDGGTRPPRPIADADRLIQLPNSTYEQKLTTVTDTYGFGGNSFEVRAAGRTEAFWTFENHDAARAWMEKQKK